MSWLRRGAAQTIALARKTYETVTGPTRGSRPALGTTVTQPAFGPYAGTWTRLAEAQWLGNRTPAHITHPVRKLMRRDSQVSLGLAALKGPFFGLEYYLQGGRPIVRSFLRKTLLDAPIWSELLWSILNAIDFGCQTHEYCWMLANVDVSSTGEELLEEDGEDASKVTLRDQYVIRRMRDLDPELVQLVADEFGDLKGVRLLAGLMGDALNAELLPERVLHAVNEKEHDNLLGIAKVDRAYPHWFDNNVALIHFARYLEQKGNPPLIGYAPAERRRVDPKDPNSALLDCGDVLNEALASFRNGSACSLPDERDEKTGQPRWAITSLSIQDKAEQFLSSLRYNDAKILRALWVPERTATQDSSVGSNAMAQVHLDVFMLALEHAKETTVLGPINEVARALVHYNFGKSETVPRVRGTELGSSSNDILKQVYLKLVGLPDTEAAGIGYMARELVDLPELMRSIRIPQRRSLGGIRRSLGAGAPPPGAPSPAGTPPQPARVAAAA